MCAHARTYTIIKGKEFWKRFLFESTRSNRLFDRRLNGFGELNQCVDSKYCDKIEWPQHVRTRRIRMFSRKISRKIPISQNVLLVKSAKSLAKSLSRKVSCEKSSSCEVFFLYYVGGCGGAAVLDVWGIACQTRKGWGVRHKGPL